MVHCQACGITARNYGITFHRFPKNENQKCAWIDFVKKHKGLHEGQNFKCTTLCSQHFEESCFDKTSAMKVRLKPFSVPTIHVSRSKYEKQSCTTVTAMTVHSQTENINETLLIDAMATNTSITDAATMDCSDINISIIKEKSTDNDTLQMDASQLIEQVNVDIESPSDRNVNIESLPSTSFGTFSRKTDVPLEILPSDTPKKVILKNEIASLGRLLAKKSNAIRKLQKKNWNQQKQIFKLKSVIHELGNKNLISSDNVYTIMQEFGPNEQLINRLFQKTTKGTVPKKYQEEIRKFAITLHYFSGKAYDYVRKKFNNCLPHPKSLSKWYSTVDALPGWSVEALKMIETKAKYSERQIVSALIMDEVAIRKKIEYDGKKYYRYVDFSVLLDQNRDIAREALVFMIVAINDMWKCPVGYFFINVLNGTQKMNLITQCLKALFDCGVHVVSLTFDGCQANFVMAKLFGCSLNLQNLKTSFDCENHTVQLLPDPSHMIKLVRNTFGDKKIMIDENGNIIDYRLIIKLCELQETEGLHLANKLRRQHIQFFKQKMKVKLATQLLSRSVAESLIFCKDKLNLEDFKNCDATVNFVKIMNDVFDILNSHKLSGFGFKKAVCGQNIQSTKDFAVRFNKYISGLKFDNGQCVVESNRKTGFIGIAVCLQSILNIYDMHINCVNPSLKFLPVYKCSQDHIELFFRSIRSHGGYNNNPTCRQFIAAYKRLLIHAEIREGGLGNCVPLSQINILNCLSSKQKLEDQINNSCSSSVGFLEKTFKDKEVENIDHDHDYFSANTTLSQYCKEVVIYIAGFVSRKLGKSLACESCVGALFGNKENLMASLIQVKNRGGLAYPSDNVIKICTVCEKFYRREAFSQQNLYKIKKDELIQRTMAEFLYTSVFEELQSHALDNYPLENHINLLLKAIAENYFNLRIKYACNSISASDKIRNFYTNLILFKGQ